MSQYLDWKVGDRVVYAPSDPTRARGKRHKPLTVGRVYTIREMLGHPLTGEVGVMLAEVVNTIHPAYGRERGYYARSFRKVQSRKTDISIFTAMLHDKRSKVGA